MNCFNLFIFHLLINSYGVLQAQSFVKLDRENIQIEWLDTPQVCVTIPFKISKGYHIQSDQIAPDYLNLKASRVAFNSYPGLEVNKVNFIVNQYEKLQLGKNLLEVIQDTFQVKVYLELKTSNPSLLRGELHFQACDAIRCFFPSIFEFNIVVDPRSVERG